MNIIILQDEIPLNSSEGLLHVLLTLIKHLTVMLWLSPQNYSLQDPKWARFKSYYESQSSRFFNSSEHFNIKALALARKQQYCKEGWIKLQQT